MLPPLHLPFVGESMWQEVSMDWPCRRTMQRKRKQAMTPLFPVEDIITSLQAGAMRH